MTLPNSPPPRYQSWFASSPSSTASLSSSATAFDGFNRPSARDIQAKITAVENADNDDHDSDGGDEGDNHVGKEVDASQDWLHSHAFEIMSVRNSNASWDKRMSSRDVMAKIRAVEQYETKKKQQEQGVSQQELAQVEDQVEEQMEANISKQRSTTAYNRSPSRSFPRQQQQGDESLAIIDEGPKIDPDHHATSFEFQGKADIDISESGLCGDNAATSDDDISELSEPINIVDAAFKRRSIPQALFVPSNNVPIKSLDDVPRKSEEVPTIVKVEMEEEPIAKVETEEEKKRRERAEARAKKLEAMHDRRNTGEDDDDDSTVSAISKRHRRRRKKKSAVSLTTITSESNLMSTAKLVKMETEAERQRKQRAEKRAKKLENMFDLRNRNTGEGDDDATTVTGISKRHRLRRKKSALAAISPEERERNDWKKNIYASVFNAERVQWRTSIYGHVMNAEATRARNSEAKRDLDEQNAAAQRRLENQRRLDQRAKKFASRAERFHKIRREGYGNDDDDASVSGSVVSSASKLRRRRRGRKSSAKHSLVHPVGEEETAEAAAPAPIVLTAEEKEKQEREQWCNSVYTNAMQAEQCQWKKKIYGHAIHAEELQRKRQELEAQIAKERAAYEARRKKERQNELRRKKMEKINQIRGSGARENIAPDADDDQSVANSTAGSTSMQRMRNRRRKAAKKATSK